MTNTVSTQQWADELIRLNPLLLVKIQANTAASDSRRAQALLVEVVRFVYLCGVSEHTLTPSDFVDRGWHELILFTRTYADFCQTRIGRFVHHQPSADKSENQQQYQQTLELYQQIFGPMQRDYWPSPQQISSCGTCED